MTFPHYKRLFKEPDQSFFLFGPRGTGKSTVIVRRFPDALVIDLLLTKERKHYLAQPDLLLDVVRAQPPGKVIFIDEIQKVPELLSLVHVLIEEKKEWLFVLSGSSARKLKREGVDLLGGRALKKVLHPFMAVELGNDFDVVDALKFGMLPLRYAAKDPLDTLQTYVGLYLEEEVKAEGLVRELEPFARFLEVVSFSHGSILNTTNIARECMVKRTTVHTWLEILKDLLISFEVPVFNKRPKRILTAQPKFYLFDAGVYHAIRPRSIWDEENEINGVALEGLVGQHLRAWVDYTREKHTLYFWRTKAGIEVDFVVFGAMGLWAIEVKHAEFIQPAHLRPLKIFMEDYPEAQPILVYRGSKRLLKDGILCVPVEEFLLSLCPDQSIELLAKGP